MITGNMVLSRKPNCDDLRTGMICGSCLCECDEVGIDCSFSDHFGYVTNWGSGSSCCEGEVFEGKIFLDTRSTHIARKDHANGRIKKGDKYVKHIRKGYYIDDKGMRHGIFDLTKRKVT